MVVILTDELTNLQHRPDNSDPGQRTRRHIAGLRLSGLLNALTAQPLVFPV